MARKVTGMAEVGRMMRWMAATLTKLGSRGKSTREAASDEITLDTRLMREPDVVGVAVGDSWVLHDRRAEQYYTLPGVAGDVWELLGEDDEDDAAEPATTVARIAETIRDRYKVPADVPVERDVCTAARHLVQLRVVRVAGVAGPVAVTMPSRAAQPLGSHW